MNRYPQGWLVGHVEKIPAAGGEHPIIRQRRIETPITVIITTALAQRNNAGDAIGKYLGGCSLAQRKPSDQRFASSKFERAPPAESLPAPKNFFAKTSFAQRLPSLWDRTIFGQVFGRGGMTEISKRKVPLPGGQARRNKPGTTRHCCAACRREQSPCQLGAVHTWHLMTFRGRISNPRRPQRSTAGAIFLN